MKKIIITDETTCKEVFKVVIPLHWVVLDTEKNLLPKLIVGGVLVTLFYLVHTLRGRLRLLLLTTIQSAVSIVEFIRGIGFIRASTILFHQ